jgi:hypothetical protein
LIGFAAVADHGVVEFDGETGERKLKPLICAPAAHFAGASGKPVAFQLGYDVEIDQVAIGEFVGGAILVAVGRKMRPVREWTLESALWLRWGGDVSALAVVPIRDGGAVAPQVHRRSQRRPISVRRTRVPGVSCSRLRWVASVRDQGRRARGYLRSARRRAHRGGTHSPRTVKKDGTAIINNMLSMIIDPEAMCGAAMFEDEVEIFIGWVKSARPQVGVAEVLAPGEPERQRRADRQKNGVPIDGTTWKQLVDLAHEVRLNDAEITRANSTGAAA